MCNQLLWSTMAWHFLSGTCPVKPLYFHSLLASFDLKCLTATSTHKSGNQLDLIYTCDCTADNILVQPLHISDHLMSLNLHYTWLPRCHQPPYQLPLDETYAPHTFLPPIFPL